VRIAAGTGHIGTLLRSILLKSVSHEARDHFELNARPRWYSSSDWISAYSRHRLRTRIHASHTEPDPSAGTIPRRRALSSALGCARLHCAHTTRRARRGGRKARRRGAERRRGRRGPERTSAVVLVDLLEHSSKGLSALGRQARHIVQHLDQAARQSRRRACSPSPSGTGRRAHPSSPTCCTLQVA
jgi:hypothetical protein